MSELLVERDSTTLTLTLNRPDKMNALSAALVEALLQQVAEAGNSGIRLLVLKGSGRNFSAGFDFGGYEDQSEGDLVLRFIRIEQLLQAIRHAPFDTLALAHGRNFGAGVDLICSCGRRIADPGATFRMPGLAFGLVLGTRRYAERVGGSRARIVLGDVIVFDAEEALADGFLTARVPTAEWPEAIANAAEAANRLSPEAAAALHGATAADTRAQDLADLVTSAARPGLKERIRAYRA
ncbi:enoyl-CoA hydratase/isomerase family protein [Methylobacterium oxalidis]|uniref:Enoyl-CoA hydratase n=1 Tax=Methylobacterium oxalidis TaxID=944322 RepID=A0A512JAL0_9HYPH|nr:enoyl-CoA hydratase/isomerase family protein [Methylobacterium oxalidis]GEP06909.1 enoyl-CoA hydratase [Methylobacterium oxalidis]GJE33102.1 putative enoyl-CoA hydratase echA6 [Methylobacterium oxalidis]GLS64398.1 enoyl-CoA hydratase [Methylobacterium oxalidis]